jgi:hypothetical protein
MSSAAAFASPASSLSGRPSRWRQQHGSIEAPRVDAHEFRQGWRAVRPLDRLLRQRAITLREWAASRHFAALHQRAEGTTLRARDPARIRVDGGQPRRGEPRERQVDALERVARVRQALGETTYALVCAVVIEQHSWTRLGRRLGVDPRTARGWSMEAIKALSML